MAYKTFKEKQRFNQTWIWALLIPISLFLIYLAATGIYTQLYLHKPWGDKPMTDNMILLFAVFSILTGIGLPLLIYSSKLITIIDEEGISYRFQPFHRKPKSLNWPDIAKGYVRKYKPISEYGGWGIRFGRSGKAFNMSGNMGIQLELTNKKKLLIGTQRPLEAQEVLEYYLVPKKA